MKVISVLILAFALVAAQNVTETKVTATKETGSASVSSSESQVVIITTQPVTATASVSNSASQEVSTTYPYTTTSYSQSESHSQVLTKTFSASESHSSSSSALTASTFTTETHASTLTAGSTYTTVAPTPTSAVSYPDLNGKWTVHNPQCPIEIFDVAYQVSNLNQANSTVYLFTPVNATFSGGLVIEDAAGNFVGFSLALAACKGNADAAKNTGKIVCVQQGVTCTAELSRSAVVTSAQPTATPSTTTATAITATETHVVAVPNIAGVWDVSNLKGPEADKAFDKQYTVTGPASGNYTLFTFTAATPAYGQGEAMESADGTFVGVSGKLTGCHGKIDVNAGTGNIVCTVSGTDLTADLKRQAAKFSTYSETITVTRQAPTDTNSGAAVIAVSFMLIAVALF